MQILIHRILFFLLESLVLVLKWVTTSNEFLVFKDDHIGSRRLLRDAPTCTGITVSRISRFTRYNLVSRYTKYYNATWYNIGGIQLIRCTVPVEPSRSSLSCRVVPFRVIVASTPSAAAHALRQYGIVPFNNNAERAPQKRARSRTRQKSCTR